MTPAPEERVIVRIDAKLTVKQARRRLAKPLKFADPKVLEARDMVLLHDTVRRMLRDTYNLPNHVLDALLANATAADLAAIFEKGVEG
jgi:hypothetical protein